MRNILLGLGCLIIIAGCSSDRPDFGGANAVPFCGDGELGTQETCDDANSEGADGCSATCEREDGWLCDGEPSECEPICGDGELVGEELGTGRCDDGNVLDGDGCSSECEVEPDEECPEEASRCLPTCGDGVVDEGEGCDDSNDQADDGCDSSCEVERGWDCDDEPSNCKPVCGDGELLGDELSFGHCDDENEESGDGCSDLCLVESGWECENEPSKCTPLCGDGKLVGGELQPDRCDDANDEDEDGCDSSCEIEQGWECDDEPSECTPLCGDGRRVGDELQADRCDDANDEDDDGCNSSCDIERGWDCDDEPSECTPVCGDGELQGDELTVGRCDDGNSDSGDGCSQRCEVEPQWTCLGEPSQCTATCTEGGETCPVPQDPGVDPPCQGGSAECAASCGDGNLDAQERCDDANNANNDGCASNCDVESGWTCSGAPSTCVGICGDGVRVGPEQNADRCDDNNIAPKDGCDELCRVETGWICSGQPSACAETCGDGNLDAMEECDDGNTISGDGCSPSCTTEAGWSCSGAPSSCDELCGDGVVDTGEQCDDGNGADGDGCAQGCTVEAGWECNDAPSDCTVICGDGLLTSEEQCDDGNADEDDGCDANCGVEAGWSCEGEPSLCLPNCGDGTVGLSEECDDGNGQSSDGCSSACVIEPGWVCESAPSGCSRIALPEIVYFTTSETVLGGGGGQINLSWSVTGADTLFVQSDVIPDVGAVTGTLVSVSVNQSTTFTLLASNAGGTVERSVRVEVSAQGDLSWAMNVGTPDSDEAKGITTDGSGNIIIVGHTWGDLDGSNEGGYDAFVTKHAPTGTPLWERQLGTSGHDVAYGAAVDGNGNILIAGFTEGDLAGDNQGGEDVFLAKYSEDGDLLWKRQLGTTSADVANGIAVLESDSVVVAGYTEGGLDGGNEGGYDAFVLKYSAGGDLLWQRQLGSTETDNAYGIAAAGDETVVLAGYTGGGLAGDIASDSSDGFVAKYAASGDLLWIRQLGIAGEDQARGVSVDDSGNILITGFGEGDFAGSGQGGQDVVTAKYSSGGDVLWRGRFGTTAQDVANGVASDSSGNVFVTGYTFGGLDGDNLGNSDAFVAKYSSSGTLLWIRQLGTPENDQPNGVAADANGNLFVSGETSGDLGGGNKGSNDAFIARYR